MIFKKITNSFTRTEIRRRKIREKIRKKSINKNKVNSNINIEKISQSNKSKNESSITRVITPIIELSFGKFMNTNLTEVSFIFCNRTCFDSELL